MDEQSPRSMWPLARIVEVIKGHDGLVRSVKLKSKQRVLTRPITKIVLRENVINAQLTRIGHIRI